jgi:hypothetical protein
VRLGVDPCGCSSAWRSSRERLCSPTSALDLELVGDVLAIMGKLAAAWRSGVVVASGWPRCPAADQVAWKTWWVARASFAPVGSEVR